MRHASKAPLDDAAGSPAAATALAPPTPRIRPACTILLAAAISVIIFFSQTSDGFASPDRIKGYESHQSRAPDSGANGYRGRLLSAVQATKASKLLVVAENEDEAADAAALEKAGDTALDLGKQADAKASFEQAIAIRRRLAAADSQSPRRAMAVIVLLTKIGFIQNRQGDIAAARATFKDQLGIVRSILAVSPGNPDWQSLLVTTLQQLTEVQLALSAFSDAQSAAQEALDASRRLVAPNPDSPAEREQLILSLTNMADVEMALGQPSEAQKTYQEILDLLRPIAARDPNAQDVHRDLLITLARMNELTGDLSYARQALDVALAMRRRGILAGSDAPIVEQLRKIINK